MFTWIVDNQITALIFLAIIAAAFGAMWWNTRKTQWLISALATCGLTLAVVVLNLLVETDSQRLARNIEQIRDLVNNRKYDEALNYFDDKVNITTAIYSGPATRRQILDAAKATKEKHSVQKIDTGKVDIDELKPPHAKISFVVWDADEPGKRGRCIMDCELKEGKWLVTSMSVEAIIGGSKMPVLLFPQ
jgi:hypothetical protein